MEERKIEYHSSYTDEENRMLQDYIENASEKELVELVEKLQELYNANVPSISASLKQLQKEVRERDILKKQYEALKKCRTEWQNYQKALFNYKDAIIIRKEFNKFKKNYVKPTGKYVRKNLFEAFRKHLTCETTIYTPCDDYLHKAILSDGTKWQTKKPEPPHIFYSTVDEIDVTPLSDSESLENIGKDNLKYLIMIMLYHVDSPTAIEIPVAISFLTRKYAETNHKQKEKLPIFATNLLSIPELIEKNQELLTNISILREECNNLLIKIEKIE